MSGRRTTGNREPVDSRDQGLHSPHKVGRINTQCWVSIQAHKARAQLDVATYLANIKRPQKPVWRCF